MTRAIDWAALTDGRVHRLTRGRQFDGDPRAVVLAARAAAEERGKVALTAREDLGKHAAYVWVQFADGRVGEGSPCPRCGSTELLREHPTIVHCPRCGARLVLEPSEDPLDGTTEDLLGTAPSTPAVAFDRPESEVRQRPQARLLDSAELPDRLEFFDDIHLRIGTVPPAEVTTFVGWARVASKSVLLRIRFFPDRESPDLGDHRIDWLPVRPFGRAIDLSAIADWPALTIGREPPAGTERLVAIHPYISRCEPQGTLHIPVVAAPDRATSAAPAPAR